MAKIPVGLQLYTVRDETAKDFIGTLQRVAKIGYTGVEFAGYGNLAASEMKMVLDDLGLRPSGSHVGLDMLETSLNAVLDYQLAIGNPYIAIPWATAASAEEWRALATRIVPIGQACAKLGIALCYHNHAGEFERYDDETALDLLYASVDPRYLKAELDLYWVQKGGADPAAYIRRYASRVPLLHVKDMAADGSFAEVGTGTLDWKAIFAAAPLAGVEWYIVEQDSCQRPPLEAVEISFRNLKAMGIA